MSLGEMDPTLSSILAIVGAAAIIATAGLVFRTWRAVAIMSAHVLPHFVPPSATEIRDGVVDNTLPAKVQRLSDDNVSTSSALKVHLIEETADAVARALVDQAVEEHLAAGERRMGAIEEKLDETLDQLCAGNPEIKRLTR